MTARRDAGAGRVRRGVDMHDVALLEREVGSVVRARQWLRDLLERHPVAGTTCEDALVVISELVTNALQHGMGLVTVRASITRDGGIQLAVTDSGDGSPALQPVDHHRIGGVGLRLVNELSSGWGVARFPGGKTVWAVLEAPAS
jgi:serine/threonine-protein kinase RsbW